MSKLTKFTKIGQYRNVVKSITERAKFTGLDADNQPIYDESAEMPVLSFKGTVKLHGTNASVVCNSDGDIYYQSRRDVITPLKDNAGFAAFAETNKEVFSTMFMSIESELKETGYGVLDNKSIAIYGEWCGGNIQKGVAINGLPKMFVIFAVKIVDELDDENNVYLPETYWSDLCSPEDRIYNINDYKTFFLMIDFKDPAQVQNKLVELTESVEQECPVAKEFGNEGIGEGIVWTTWWNGDRYVFKTKGEKHSNTKVKKVVEVDIEKLNSVKEFVEYAVTENRLEQGIEQVFTIRNIEPDRKHTGDYLKWVVADVVTEELDTLTENGLEPKDVNKEISITARKYFFKYLDEKVGL